MDSGIAVLAGKAVEWFPFDLSYHLTMFRFYNETPKELTRAVLFGLTEHHKRIAIACERAPREEAKRHDSGRREISEGCIAVCGRMVERFPRHLPEDLMGFYIAYPAELTVALRFGLVEYHRRHVAEEAAAEEVRRVARRILLANVTNPVVGMEIDFGDGWHFMIVEVAEFDVNFSLTIDSFALTVVPGRFPGLKHLVGAPEPGKRRIKLVAGYFSKPWTETDVSTLIAQPGCRFKGSGMHAREAFISLRPDIDRYYFYFVGDPNSRWEWEGRVFFSAFDGYSRHRQISGVDTQHDGHDYLACLVWE